MIGRPVAVLLTLLLMACGAGPTRHIGEGEAPGETAAVADAILELPAWAPEGRPVHAPSPGWAEGDLEFAQYLSVARRLAGMEPASIVDGYVAALERAGERGAGLLVRYNLYVMSRLLFHLPETEPLATHRAFIVERGMRLPPRTVARIRWPVEVDDRQRVVGIAPPMSFVVSSYDAVGELRHFVAHHTRRAPDTLGAAESVE